MASGSDTEFKQQNVLLVTRNMPPLRGGMERLNLHIAIELSKQFELQVIGPNGCSESLPKNVSTREVQIKPLWLFLLKALFETLRLAKKKKPQIVIAGSGLTAPMAALGAKICGGRSVVYAHGLDLVVSHRLYRALWLPFLRRCDFCVVNSRNTAILAAQAGILPGRISVIHPGVELPDDTGAEARRADFRRRHDLSCSKVLLSVGRLTPRKGLLEFVQNALARIAAAHPEVKLVVIGDEAPNALNGTNKGGAIAIMNCASELGLEQHVLMLGACNDAELDAAYDASDLCVFPLRNMPGDVEGFGMVAVEAAAHGLPTIAFNIGGVADAIHEGRSGWLIPAGDYNQMAERTISALKSKRTATMRADIRRFAATFEWNYFGAALRDQIGKLIYPKGRGFE